MALLVEHGTSCWSWFSKLLKCMVKCHSNQWDLSICLKWRMFMCFSEWHLSQVGGSEPDPGAGKEPSHYPLGLLSRLSLHSLGPRQHGLLISYLKDECSWSTCCNSPFRGGHSLQDCLILPFSLTAPQNSQLLHKWLASALWLHGQFHWLNGNQNLFFS